MDRYFKDQANCAHAWAHQGFEAGHASNLFFEGKTIYSYGHHFPIATIDGQRVFFTTQSYSKTTGKHKSITRSALSHKTFIWVEYVPISDHPAKDKEFQHKNIAFWTKEISQILEEIDKHPRKKSLWREVEQNVHYLKTFMEELNIRPTKKLTQLLEGPTIQTIGAYLKNEKNKKAKTEQKQKEKREKEFQASLSEWESGIKDTLGFYDSPYSYLRLNNDKQRIETSKGIEIPLEAAKRFWDFIKKILPTGCQQCNYKILNYNVDEISTEFIKIGCHTIPMLQAQKIAAQLEW